MRGVFLESGGADVRSNGSNDTRTSCSAYLTRAFYFHAIKIYDACNEVRHHFYFLTMYYWNIRLLSGTRSLTVRR